MIPEVSGLTVEEIEDIFKGPWFNAYQTTRKTAIEGHPEDGEAGIHKTL
jgi:hypothetical protein